MNNPGWLVGFATGGVALALAAPALLAAVEEKAPDFTVPLALVVVAAAWSLLFAAAAVVVAAQQDDLVVGGLLAAAAELSAAAAIWFARAPHTRGGRGGRGGGGGGRPRRGPSPDDDVDWALWEDDLARTH